MAGISPPETDRPKRMRLDNGGDGDGPSNIDASAIVLSLHRQVRELMSKCTEMELHMVDLDRDNLALQEDLLESRGDAEVLRSDRNSLVWYKEQYEWISCNTVESMRLDGLLSLNAHLAHLQGKVASRISHVCTEEESAIKEIALTNGRALVAFKAMEGCVVCGDSDAIADNVFCPCSHYMCATCADRMRDAFESDPQKHVMQCPVCRREGDVMQLRGMAEVTVASKVDVDDDGNPTP